MPATERKTARRAENLDDLVNTILALPSRPFSVNEFRASLLNAKKPRKRKDGTDKRARVGDSTLSDYFAVARDLGFVRKADGSYEVPKAVIASIRERQDKHELREYVGRLLINNLDVVRRFLDFIKGKPRTPQELSKEFNPQTAGILVSWLTWSGILQRNRVDGRYYSVALDEVPMSLEGFWTKMLEAYESLRSTPLVGVKATYVKIPDLREVFCTSNAKKRQTFDALLKRALSDPRFRRKIEVTGAPISYIAEEEDRSEAEPLVYDDRVFYFIAIKR